MCSQAGSSCSDNCSGRQELYSKQVENTQKCASNSMLRQHFSIHIFSFIVVCLTICTKVALHSYEIIDKLCVIVSYVLAALVAANSARRLSCVFAYSLFKYTTFCQGLLTCCQVFMIEAPIHHCQQMTCFFLSFLIYTKVVTHL